MDGSFEKSLRLVISFGHLKRAQFLDALQERLEPRLKQVREWGERRGEAGGGGKREGRARSMGSSGDTGDGWWDRERKWEVG